MIIQLAILFTLVGIAIGSFLNVCIDRLPPKRLLYMGKIDGERFDIEIGEGVFREDPIELFKDKKVYVSGKITKNLSTGNLQINITEASQIIVQEETFIPGEPISWEVAKNKVGDTVILSGEITGGITQHQSLVSPPSHCDTCQRQLGLLDNIPIFSYLFLRGRCRYCGAHIPVRVFLVEFITGLLFFLAFWRYGLTAQFGITAFWCCIFLVIIFIDWEHKLILNVITYPAIIIAVVILAVHTYGPGIDFLPPEATLINGLISGAALFVFFMVFVIFMPGAMGMGDAKLVALIGLVSGFPLVVFSAMIGILAGGVVAIIIMAIKIKGNWKESICLFKEKRLKDGFGRLFQGRKDVIAYGTFLGIGPIIALIFAASINSWYLGFF
jgi:leader peptidase (prepilin peptidase)/N-methyltransferase